MDRKLPNMKTALTVILLSVLFAITAGRADSRLYTDADGFISTRVCDMLEDSHGMIWIATWIGVDRFDGLSFRKFRSYPEDAVKLDNNRVERVFETENGDICIATYGDLVFRINPLTGRFEKTGMTAGDVARYPARVNVTTAADGSRIMRLKDSKGGVWEAADRGLVYSAARARNPMYIPSKEVSPSGRSINALYADREGRLWSGSRDGRVVIFDTNNGAFRRIGNLTDSGALTPDSTAVISARPYAFFEDRRGRIWLGTKSGELRILTPRRDGRFDVGIYKADAAKDGALRCADIYDFAEDGDGRVWLATFGGGPAFAEEGSDGMMRFTHLPGYPPARALVRKLLPLPGGDMAAACPYGLIIFPTREAVKAAKAGNAPEYTHHCSETDRSSSLGNNDILNMILTPGDTLWLAAYSGGVDFAPVSRLRDAECAFGHAPLTRDGSEPLVQTVMRPADGSMLISTARTLSVYHPGFAGRAMSFNTANLGIDAHFTEATPQRLADGRIVYGMEGGLLVVEPARLPTAEKPRLAVTAVRSKNIDYVALPPDSIIRLARGTRDTYIGFAAGEYSAPENIDYRYRLDDGEWNAVETPGQLLLMNLPAGTHTVELRSTDRYGNDADNPLRFRIAVPYTAGEIVFFIIFGVGILFIAGVAVWLVRKYYRTRRLKSRLREAVRSALEPDTDSAKEGELAERIIREVGRNYATQDLRVESVAKSLGADRGSVRAELKRLTGVSFEDFLRRVRVLAAARMLRSGSDLNISQVAYACGFKSSQYMSMVFKELTGKTPSEYAKR